MAVVISDAGPLIALAKVDSLFVAQELFSRVRIPGAVWSECLQKPGEDSRRIEQAVRDGWISVVSVHAEQASRRFSSSLGKGEREAMKPSFDG